MSARSKRQHAAGDAENSNLKPTLSPKRTKEDKVDSVILIDEGKSKRAYYFNLLEKPCAVLHITANDAFIVGTYELVDIETAKKWFPNLSNDELVKKLEAVNYRLGSLHLYVNTYSALGYREFNRHFCASGGVFDIAQSYEIYDAKNAKGFYVAHANGTIGHYGIQIDEIVPFGEPIKVVDEKTVSLTSIDCIGKHRKNDKPLVVVGDSDGNVSILVWQLDKNTSSYKESHTIIKTRVCQHPVWQVKLLSSKESLDSNLIFATDHHLLVGADDSKWYIYKFDHERQELIQLYKNDDFQAGVTCLCLRAVGDHHLPLYPFRLFVGSYDETIREYTIVINQGENVKPIEVTPNGILKVPGAGIWRIDYMHHINHAKNPPKAHDTLNVATMYTDPCRIIIPTRCDTARTSNSIDEGIMHQVSCELYKKSGERPLYYGFVQSMDGSNYCILDFNNRLCTFIENDAQYTRQDMDSIKSYSTLRERSFSMQRWLAIGAKAESERPNKMELNAIMQPSVSKTNQIV